MTMILVTPARHQVLPPRSIYVQRVFVCVCVLVKNIIWSFSKYRAKKVRIKKLHDYFQIGFTFFCAYVFSPHKHNEGGSNGNANYHTTSEPAIRGPAQTSATFCRSTPGPPTQQAGRWRQCFGVRSAKPGVCVKKNICGHEIQNVWMDARMFLDLRVQNPRQVHLLDPYRQKKGGLLVSTTEKFRVDSCSTTKKMRMFELPTAKRAVELCPPRLSDMWGISFKAPPGVSCIDTKRFKRRIIPFFETRLVWKKCHATMADFELLQLSLAPVLSKDVGENDGRACLPHVSTHILTWFRFSCGKQWLKTCHGKSIFLGDFMTNVRTLHEAGDKIQHRCVTMVSPWFPTVPWDPWNNGAGLFVPQQAAAPSMTPDVAAAYHQAWQMQQMQLAAYHQAPGGQPYHAQNVFWSAFVRNSKTPLMNKRGSLIALV